ncbi:MAG: hypothetical protein GY856_49445 [bacterium]|nr:hypothetical protein [bacterium]
MFPSEILERNRAYVDQRTPEPLPAVEAVPLAIVSCFDPRLDPLLRPALGLREGEGFFLRTAGALLSPGDGALRSLAVAVYLFEVRQILIVGHTSCRMASFPTTSFIDAFRRRGVAREAFGDDDLRRWAGAIANPRQGVLATAAAIAGAPFLPRDLTIAGTVLDDTTGRLELVLRPDQRPSAKAVAPAAAGAPAADLAAAQPAAAKAAPAPPAAVVERVAPPSSGLEEPLAAVRSSLHQLAARAGKGVELHRLREALAAEAHPYRQLALIEDFAARAATDTRDLISALSRLKGEAAVVRKELSPRNVAELFRQHLTGEGKQ